MAELYNNGAKVQPSSLVITVKGKRQIFMGALCSFINTWRLGRIIANILQT